MLSNSNFAKSTTVTLLFMNQRKALASQPYTNEPLEHLAFARKYSARFYEDMKYDELILAYKSVLTNNSKKRCQI
eukprot:Em0003g157a